MIHDIFAVLQIESLCNTPRLPCAVQDHESHSCFGVFTRTPCSSALHKPEAGGFYKNNHRLFHAGAADASNESPGPSELPATVFEDKGNQPTTAPPESAAVTPPPGELRNAIAGLLQQHSTGSPLWTAYATHEMVHGSVKVCFCMTP